MEAASGPAPSRLDQALNATPSSYTGPNRVELDSDNVVYHLKNVNSLLKEPRLRSLANQIFELTKINVVLGGRNSDIHKSFEHVSGLASAIEDHIGGVRLSQDQMAEVLEQLIVVLNNTKEPINLGVDISGIFAILKESNRALAAAKESPP